MLLTLACVQALENVPFAFASTLTLVPVGQMVDVLKVTTKEVVLKPRMWVRVKRGKYANDLAQVCMLLSLLKRQ
jgi:transcription elongation factor SPT5